MKESLLGEELDWDRLSPQIKKRNTFTNLNDDDMPQNLREQLKKYDRRCHLHSKPSGKLQHSLNYCAYY